MAYRLREEGRWRGASGVKDGDAGFYYAPIAALRDLPDREREIVLMRFGLEGRRELTQKEVAQKMGISQSYISRLEKRIMLRLKKEFLRQTSCA